MVSYRFEKKLPGFRYLFSTRAPRCVLSVNMTCFGGVGWGGVGPGGMLAFK